MCDQDCLARRLGLAALFLLAGCTTLAPDARQRNADAFRAEITARTQAAIPSGQALTLNDCVALALQHNLALKAAQVDAAIASLDKDIAFAEFLPHVQASARVTGWQDQPMSSLAGVMVMPLHDKTLRDYSVDVTMPLFVPSTWLLYSMRTHGEAIRDLVVEQTRQGVVLQVTARYYECLERAEEATAQASQVASAAAFAAELEQLHSEGLVLDWERDLAKAAQTAREAQLREIQRAEQQAKADLLNAIGLDPLADVTLAPETPHALPDEPLEALVYQALLLHPALHVADREVAISEDAVKLAIAQFLPNILGFASFTGTTNSGSIPASNMMGGVSAVLSVFDGFANIEAYRAAREERGKAFIEREARCLTVMAQVYGAYLNVQTISDYRNAADQALAAYDARAAATKAQFDEGIALASDTLEAMARRDDAASRLTTLRYKQQLSVAVLRNAMGVPYSEGEGAAVCTDTPSDTP